jgi:LuxR family maltose regulon positive regulatory protein
LLDSALRQVTCPVTVVHAPAGFGKSTFMAQWHAALTTRDPRAARWITLDPQHQQPGAFASALLIALDAPAECDEAGQRAR